MPRAATKRKSDSKASSEPESKSKPKPTQKSMTGNDVGPKNGLAGFLTNDTWASHLSSEFSQDYFKKLETQYGNDVKSGLQVFPPENLIFNCFNRTSLPKVKVVLLGQDPYHDDGQAMGLAFSVPKSFKVPPSLKNMYKELVTDISDFKDPGHGCLDHWADQGVLLLNTTLTVIAHKPNSHSKIGWQTFTDKVIRIISDNCDSVVFMLWGNFSQKKEKLIDSGKHTILKDAHPSPLSFGKFKDCKCFSRANDALKKMGKSPINW